MPIELSEFKANKDGLTTPKILTRSLVDWVETGDVKSLIVVVETKEGEILTGYSQGNTLERLGLIEIAKTEIIEETF